MNKGIGRLRERGHYREGFGEETFISLLSEITLENF